MQKELNYYEDLFIDGKDMHKLVDEQPSLFMQYGELAADKRDELNEQKVKLKVLDSELKKVSAELYIKYKKTLIDGKSPTETFVSSLIEKDPEYTQKYDETIKELRVFNKLSHQLDILDVAVTSFQQRKNMIENKIDLVNKGYNSEVKQDYDNKIHDKLNGK